MGSIYSAGLTPQRTILIECTPIVCIRRFSKLWGGGNDSVTAPYGIRSLILSSLSIVFVLVSGVLTFPIILFELFFSI